MGIHQRIYILSNPGERRNGVDCVGFLAPLHALDEGQVKEHVPPMSVHEYDLAESVPMDLITDAFDELHQEV